MNTHLGLVQTTVSCGTNRDESDGMQISEEILRFVAYLNQINTGNTSASTYCSYSLCSNHTALHMSLYNIRVGVFEKNIANPC